MTIDPSSVFSYKMPLPYGVYGNDITPEASLAFTKSMSSQFAPYEIKGLTTDDKTHLEFDDQVYANPTEKS